MARLLVIYGTTTEHTGKIARALADTLRTEGHDVDVVEASNARAHPDDYAGVMVAASLHAGAYQKSVRRWVRTHATALRDKPTAFVSVCLGVLQKDPKVHAHLRAIIDGFVKETGWRPMTTTLVAGALLYTRYTFFIRWVMKRMARAAGGDTDTSRDYEYTDWNALRAFAQQFAQRVKPAAAAPAVKETA